MIIKKREMKNMSNHTGSGSPNKNENFIEKNECKLDRMFKLRPRGMLKKEQSQQMGMFSMITILMIHCPRICRHDH